MSTTSREQFNQSYSQLKLSSTYNHAESGAEEFKIELNNDKFTGELTLSMQNHLEEKSPISPGERENHLEFALN